MYKLSNNNIDGASDFMTQSMKKLKIDDKEITRVRLVLEEILMYYRNNLGENNSFDIKFFRSLGSARIRLKFPGRALDLNIADGTDDEEIITYIHRLFSINPTWHYNFACNFIDIPVNYTRRVSQAVKMLGAVICAAIVGSLGLLLPQELRTQIAESICDPIFNTFMGLITAISGPLIFLTMVNAIASIGDIKTLSLIGRKTISRYVLLMFLSGIIFSVIGYLLYGISSFDATQMNFSDIFSMLLNIFPNNIIQPFLDGNTVQIIFIAICVGVILLILGNRLSAISTIAEQANILTQYAMRGLAIIMPIPIFINIVSMIINGKIASLVSTLGLVVIILALWLILMLLHLLYACVKLKTRPIEYFKYASVPFIISLTTASSAASLEENISFCENKLGIDKRIARFGVPLGNAMYKMPKVGMYILLSFGFAQLYHVEITPTWIIMLTIISVMIALSSPPVPGASMTAVLFPRVGIPPQALGIAITMEIFFDFPGTGTTIFSIPPILAGLAKKLKMLDINKINETEPEIKSKNVKPS